MGRDRAAAGWAPPSFLFFPEKLSGTAIPDFFEVCDRARAVVFPVSFVEGAERSAGKLRAFRTELKGPFTDAGAPFFKKGALLVPGPTAGAVRHPDPVLSESMCPGEVRTARAAVYPTGCDQLRVFIHGSIFPGRFFNPATQRATKPGIMLPGTEP
jgi:hypothetical protein